EETAIDLANYFGSLKNLAKTDLKVLEKLRDIGPKISVSIYNWFRNKSNIKLLEKLKKYGVKTQWTKPAAQVRPARLALEGKVFVLTGSLNSMSRDEAKIKIRVLGGSISQSAGKKTDFLVLGKDPGLKYKQAKKLGIKILSEQEFLKMLK
ncbi:unnamed protein product, partial [marine sediment metagenome]